MIELKLRGDDLAPPSWYFKFVSESYRGHGNLFKQLQTALAEFNGTLVCTIFGSGEVLWNGDQWVRITGFQFENDEDASFFLLRWS